MPWSLLPHSGRKSMGLCGKAKWTGNLVRSESSFFLLFAVLVLAMWYQKLQPPCKQKKKEWKNQGTAGSVPVLYLLLSCITIYRCSPKANVWSSYCLYLEKSEWDWGKWEPFPSPSSHQWRYLSNLYILLQCAPPHPCLAQGRQLVPGGPGHRDKQKVLGMVFSIYMYK